MSRKKGEPNTPRIIGAKPKMETMTISWVLKQLKLDPKNPDNIRNIIAKIRERGLIDKEVWTTANNIVKFGTLNKPGIMDLIEYEKNTIPKKQADEEKHALLAKESNRHKEELSKKLNDKSIKEPLPHSKVYSNELEEFIKNAYTNRDYQMSRDELIHVYSSPKYKSIIKDADPKDIADRVYEYATTKILKNKKRIKQLAQIGLSDPSLFQNLNPELQREMYEAIEKEHDLNKSKKDLKWKLPVDKPRWQKAMVLFKVNPMLSRGAYSVGSRK